MWAHHLFDSDTKVWLNTQCCHKKDLKVTEESLKHPAGNWRGQMGRLNFGARGNSSQDSGIVPTMKGKGNYPGIMYELRRLRNCPRPLSKQREVAGQTQVAWKPRRRRISVSWEGASGMEWPLRAVLWWTWQRMSQTVPGQGGKEGKSFQERSW